MKRNFHLFLLALGILITGCQAHDTEPLFSQEKPTLSSLDNLSGIQHDIMVNILANHYGGYRKDAPLTRAIEEVSLTPYIVDGDTALYIAQYPQGWEVYSTDLSSNMILFSSETGRFNMDDPSMPEQLHFLISENAFAIASGSNDNDSTIDSSWGGIALYDNQLNSNGIIKSLTPSLDYVTTSSSKLPPGHWELFETTEISSDTYTSPKLITTKWGQGYPWNSYAKWVVNPETHALEQTPAGCTPVAVAQYMYFTHYKDNIPTSSVESAILTSDKKDYHFVGSSTTIWDSMARNQYSSGTQQTALLIGKIGRALNSNYQIDGTGTTQENCVKALRSIYNKNFCLQYLTKDNVIMSIDKGYPIVARATSDKLTDGSSISPVGHTFLIDQYQTTTKTFKYLYVYKRDPLPPGTIDAWLQDFTDANGNVIKYAYTNEITESRIYSQMVSMNWGYDGLYDNIKYSISGQWPVGKYNYNLAHQLYLPLE